MREYDKIKCIYERDHSTKKIIEDKYTDKTFKYLENNKWIFTEKVDGTNIRIVWDGHRVQFYGRTDNAQIPSGLANKLFELFGGNANEELFEQKFGDKFVMLCGEGYGGKIQNGAGYKQEEDFILFDVMIGENWLERESVEDIAEYFNINIVPIMLKGTLKEAVELVKSNPDSLVGNTQIEGVVGRPEIELKERDGSRVIVKIKVKDLC